MRIRPLNLILLAGLVFWTTGAAQFAHETLEHGDHDEIAVAGDVRAERADGIQSPGMASRGLGITTPFENPAARAAQNSAPKRPAHNHDDCPTCQLLAHLQAHHVTAPAIVCVLLLTDLAPPVVNRRAPTIESQSHAPIRGPPASAAHFA